MTTVLVADDHLALLESIALELELRGYHVLQATDGRGVLNILHAIDRLPDIIVSDIAMPDIDGFQLLERVRSNPQWESLPFLFLTAFNSPNSLRISKELGADDYIVKPFQADDLVLSIENKIRRVRAFEKQAESKMDAARTNLLHLISHELRTPLLSIYGGTEMLADTLADAPDEMVQTMLNLIQNGAKRLNRFSNQGLTLLQLDSGYVDRQYQHRRLICDLSEIVRAASASLNSHNDPDTGAHRQVSVEVLETGAPLLVEGVMEYLLVMVEEPLRNAVAFSRPGGTVRVTMNREGEQIVITIRDNGPGIPQDALPQVWERFTQIERERHEHQGAGLGLTLARACARIHQGDCSIVCPPEGGTLFTLWLPAASVTAPVDG
jgi:signal transduction histidine kinase